MSMFISENLSKHLKTGAFAGRIGGFALIGARQLMYSFTSEEKKQQENRIESRDPFIVLADKLQAKTGIDMSQKQKILFEKGVVTAVSVAGGVAYAALARKWNLHWALGGALFGTLFWLVEDEGIVPALGLVGDNTKYPLEAHARGFVAHLVFGLVTAAVHRYYLKKKGLSA